MVQLTQGWIIGEESSQRVARQIVLKDYFRSQLIFKLFHFVLHLGITRVCVLVLNNVTSSYTRVTTVCWRRRWRGCRI